MRFVVSVVVSVLAVSTVVYGASTISTNIQTDGTLSITGTATVIGVGHFGDDLNVSGADFNLGTGSATTTLRTLSATLLSLTADLDIYGADLNLGTGSATTTLTSVRGQLGIGTTTPWGILSVSATSTSDGSSIPIFTVSTSTAAATTTAFVIDSNGKVGVGTTTPYTQISVTGTLAGRNFNADTPSATSTFQGGGLLATKGGNVGVGTTTPAKTLSVTGSALIGNSVGTTSVIIETAQASTGGCINLRATDGRLVRIYATTAPISGTSPWNLQVELGACQ